MQTDAKRKRGKPLVSFWSKRPASRLRTILIASNRASESTVDVDARLLHGRRPGGARRAEVTSKEETPQSGATFDTTANNA
jgi:hypothetical protein